MSAGDIIYERMEFKQALRHRPAGHNGRAQRTVRAQRPVSAIPQSSTRTRSFYEFDHAVAQANYNEMIEIAQHIRAHVILIDGSSLDEARKARERGVNVFVGAGQRATCVLSFETSRVHWSGGPKTNRQSPRSHTGECGTCCTSKISKWSRIDSPGSPL
jgi:hypothetical protein